MASSSLNTLKISSDPGERLVVSYGTGGHELGARISPWNDSGYLPSPRGPPGPDIDAIVGFGVLSLSSFSID
jgi:hypothetical protein